jgi:hypothetical protein
MTSAAVTLGIPALVYALMRRHRPCVAGIYT